MLALPRIRIASLSLLMLACDTAKVQPVDSSAARSVAATAADSSGGVASAPIPTATVSASDPGEVLREYYAAIQKRDYDRAYSLWADGGRASKQTRAQFAAGFAETSKVSIAVSDSTHLEGAAGSRYLTVPVAVDATLSDGRHQHFVGSYVLRRAMVDGATAEQREWRIYSARLKSR
jgi:hypothetical protein